MTEPAQSPDRLAVRVTQPTATVAVLHLRGELDLFTAPLVDGHVAKQLADKPRTHLVLDLTGITFFGSAGVASLVRAAESADDTEVRLVVATTNRVVLRPLQVTGIAGMLTIRDTLEAALADCV